MKFRFQRLQRRFASAIKPTHQIEQMPQFLSSLNTEVALSGHNPILIPSFLSLHNSKLMKKLLQRKKTWAAPSLEEEWRLYHLNRDKETDLLNWKNWVNDKTNLQSGMIQSFTPQPNAEGEEYFDEMEFDETKEVIQSLPLFENYPVFSKPLEVDQLGLLNILEIEKSKSFRSGFWSNIKYLPFYQKRFYLGSTKLFEDCNFQMERIDYRLGRRSALRGLRIIAPSSNIGGEFHGEKIDESAIEIIGDEVDKISNTTKFAKMKGIIKIRRKKMKKHKWKKLRRRYRDSTRFNRSKRKKNRARLMKEFKELGIEFGRNE